MVIPHDHLGRSTQTQTPSTTPTPPKQIQRTNTIPIQTSTPIPTTPSQYQLSLTPEDVSPLFGHRSSRGHGTPTKQHRPAPAMSSSPTTQHQHFHQHFQQHQQQAQHQLSQQFPVPVPLPLPRTPTGLFHILSVKQFDRNQLHNIFAVAHEMKMMVQRMGRLDILKNHLLALVFLEPSTRTMGSFEAAMLRLGGAVVTVLGDTSSVKKGESLEDTVRTVEQYADAIVLRAPGIGSAFECSNVIRKPIVNAGDGAGEHPTQAMLDTYTIRQELGTIHGLTVTFVGDLKYGRTVHSLAQMLGLYNNMTFIYVSPEELKLPRSIFDTLDKQGIIQHEYTTHSGLEEAFKVSDVVYVTRVQKERFEDPKEAERLSASFKVTPELMALAKEKMCLMHPLPRIDEISVLVDSDPRAAYFRQMENGMYLRMALLAMVLGKV